MAIELITNQQGARLMSVAGDLMGSEDGRTACPVYPLELYAKEGQSLRRRRGARPLLREES